MGILDEAIREHLELKRHHGADDSELKKLEDEAFGPPERPGVESSESLAQAEAPTEFMEQPAEAAGEALPRRRAPDIADLQEAPEPEPEPEPAEPEPEPEPESEAPAEPSTEEKQAIAEPPTELYDVEGEFTEAESRGPSEEDLVDKEISEPRLGPVDPLGAAPVEAEEEDAEVADEAEEDEDDFFDEQRLSDELDQALEGPEEDVLEETPEFLEEAPEDDRLWFEQKPPKDFDFDD